MQGLSAINATMMPDSFLLLRESISAHQTPSIHCAMPQRPTVNDMVDATPPHLHAISHRLRTTSNSTTLSSPRPTPSGRNRTPKCHRRPNRGTEVFACAHGRGGGRMIHTKASRKGIGADGVDFGAAATPAWSFPRIHAHPPDPSRQYWRRP